MNAPRYFDPVRTSKISLLAVIAFILCGIQGCEPVATTHIDASLGETVSIDVNADGKFQFEQFASKYAETYVFQLIFKNKSDSTVSLVGFKTSCDCFHVELPLQVEAASRKSLQITIENPRQPPALMLTRNAKIVTDTGSMFDIEFVVHFDNQGEGK